MSIRVHEIAKELKLTSKDVIERLKKLKVEAKSHMSVVDDKDARRLRETLKKPGKSKGAESPVSQPGSIESVKQAFLIQRRAAKTAPPAEVKKPRISPAPGQAPPAVRRAPAPPPRPVRPVPPPVKKETKIFQEKKEPEAAPQAAPAPAAPKPARKVTLDALMSVKTLSAKLSANPSDLIQRLIKAGIFANINQTINFETARKIAVDLGFEVEKSEAVEDGSAKADDKRRDPARLAVRAPIVTFMGHVDHGKTSLLDAIRKTKVAAGEAGGITQHIGAYEVFLPKGAVTFLDTPGHEAFTAMRARGAKVTDVVVLVVAADDGVMPQTIEAIDHAKAAGVALLVAINKIDLPAANPDRVKKGLMEHGLTPEDWGGKTIMIGVSAKTGQGIDELLDMLALESELLELKADPGAEPTGVVVEAELSKESGPMATVLVQEGTLRVGDAVVVGSHCGKVRAMINDQGKRVKEAPPATPVAILGLSGVPKAGDRFEAVKDERTAREIIEKKAEQMRASGAGGHLHLEQLYENIKAGKVEELKLILKSDVQGSVEALRSTLGKIKSTNVRLSIIHTGIGDVTESDVMLAAASDAVVIGFHVGMSPAVRETAENEDVDVRFYDIIYEIQAAIEKAMEGLLEPELKETFVGAAEIRQVFKVTKGGMIAGCSVQKGKIVRNMPCRVLRNGAKIHEGKIESLKRFKDDAREVLEGYECGISVSNFEEPMPGDRIEVYEIEKIARKLS